MKWGELKEGDVLMAGQLVGFARVVIKVESFPGEEFNDLDLTMLDLLTGRLGPHTRYAHHTVSNLYTVLRGSNVVQQGHG